MPNLESPEFPALVRYADSYLMLFDMFSIICCSTTIEKYKPSNLTPSSRLVRRSYLRTVLMLEGSICEPLALHKHII